MVKLPGFAENAPEALKKLFESDPEVVDYINSSIRKLEIGKDNVENGSETETDLQFEIINV
jgi:hypothetical protein